MPEGQKAGPKGRQLEVGAQRAPRLLVEFIIQIIFMTDIKQINKQTNKQDVFVYSFPRLEWPNIEDPFSRPFVGQN